MCQNVWMSECGSRRFDATRTSISDSNQWRRRVQQGLGLLENSGEPFDLDRTAASELVRSSCNCACLSSNHVSVFGWFIRGM